jgi:hypothetical protein
MHDVLGHGPHEGRCNARTRGGGHCRRWPIAGATRCRLHGAAAPQVKRAAERRLEGERVRADLVRLGVPIEEGADPLEALREALALSQGDLRAMRTITAEGVLIRPDDPRVVLYERTLDRAARVAEIASRTRLAEREAAISSAQAEALHRALEVALDSADIPQATRARVTTRLAEELRSGPPS